MTLRPRTFLVDVPASALPATTAFWAGALSAEPVQTEAGFVHLQGATSALEVHLQSIGAGPARCHLDLEADDRSAEVARVVEAGAREIARFQEGYTVLEDPAGLLLCVVDEDSTERNTLAPRHPERGYLGAVFIDVPEPDVDAEVAFWARTLGTDDPAADPDAPDYTPLGGMRAPAGELSVFVQQVDAPARYHVDLSVADVAREVARLEQLGATHVADIEDWVTLADPVGNLLCVVPSTEAAG